MWTETYEISQTELVYLKETARLTSCSSYNKALTVFVRGENVEITVLSDNTNSIYHQLYNKAYETSEKNDKETPKFYIPNFACEFAIFEIDFGTIGAANDPKEIPTLLPPQNPQLFVLAIMSSLTK